MTVNSPRSQDRKNAVVDKLFKGLQGLLKGRKVTTLTGTGTLLADHRVEVVDGEDAGKVIVGRNVVLAAGSVPRVLPGSRWTAAACSPRRTRSSDLEAIAGLGGGDRRRRHRLRVQVDFEAVERVRTAWGDRFRAEEGFALTYLPFVALRPAVEALRDFPMLNASVVDDALVVHSEVNLGIAVDLSHEGLIVPVIHRLARGGHPAGRGPAHP